MNYIDYMTLWKNTNAIFQLLIIIIYDCSHLALVDVVMIKINIWVRILKEIFFVWIYIYIIADVFAY